MKDVTTNLKLITWAESPSYKIGYLRKPQIAKKALLRVRFMLAESACIHHKPPLRDKKQGRKINTTNNVFLKENS